MLGNYYDEFDNNIYGQEGYDPLSQSPMISEPFLPVEGSNPFVNFDSGVPPGSINNAPIPASAPVVAPRKAIETDWLTQRKLAANPNAFVSSPPTSPETKQRDAWEALMQENEKRRAYEPSTTPSFDNLPSDLSGGFKDIADFSKYVQTKAGEMGETSGKAETTPDESKAPPRDKSKALPITERPGYAGYAEANGKRVYLFRPVGDQPGYTLDAKTGKKSDYAADSGIPSEQTNISKYESAYQKAREDVLRATGVDIVDNPALWAEKVIQANRAAGRLGAHTDDQIRDVRQKLIAERTPEYAGALAEFNRRMAPYGYLNQPVTLKKDEVYRGPGGEKLAGPPAITPSGQYWDPNENRVKQGDTVKAAQSGAFIVVENGKINIVPPMAAMNNEQVKTAVSAINNQVSAVLDKRLAAIMAMDEKKLESNPQLKSIYDMGKKMQEILENGGTDATKRYDAAKAALYHRLVTPEEMSWLNGELKRISTPGHNRSGPRPFSSGRNRLSCRKGLTPYIHQSMPFRKPPDFLRYCFLVSKYHPVPFLPLAYTSHFPFTCFLAPICGALLRC